MIGRRSLRVLLINNSADLYGASRALLQLVCFLRSVDADVVVVLPEDGPLRPALEAQGSEVRIDATLSIVTRGGLSTIGGLAKLIARFPRSVVRMRRLIRECRPDLVHTNTGVILSPALAARITRVPHVWHIRDWFQEFGAIWRPYSRYVQWGSSAVICISETVARQFRHRDRVEIVCDGVDRDEFADSKHLLREEFRARHKLEGCVVVGVVGRIKFVRKGQEYLVHAARALRSRGVNAVYLVVGRAAPGNEDHEERLRRMVNECGLGDCFLWLGETTDPRPAYAGMDVLVVPSGQPEPFGLVTLEAMAMGLPVVGSDAGGTAEIVVHRETGLLFPARDVKALADSLELLIGDATLRQRMGTAGSARVEEHFGLQRSKEGILRVYRAVAGL